MHSTRIFITGGSGYIGRNLIRELLKRDYLITALIRKGSESKVPVGVKLVYGNALDENTFINHIPPGGIFIHLIGVSHPSPAKANEFKNIDLVSVKASICAAKKAGVNHFIYMSVAHPAPIMRSYIEVRKEAEQLIKDSGMNATIIRPWYILGEGHRWPLMLLPLYWLFKRIPSTKEIAERLDLVKLEQVLATIIYSIQNPPDGLRIFEAPEIKESVL